MRLHLNIFITIFSIICGGTLFAVSPAFVDAYLTPKYYSAVLGGLVLGLAIVVFSFKTRIADRFVNYNSIFPIIYLIISVLCTAQAFYGILQFFSIFISDCGFRVTGSFDNPAGFAACLCAGFPFVFYFVFSKKRWKRFGAITAGIILVVAVTLSSSRAGIVGIIVVCLAIFFYKVNNTVKWKWVIAIALLLISLSGLYFLKKDSADGRLLIWRCTWEMIKEKPVFGYGTGGFKANYMDFQAKYFEEHPDSDYTMLAGNVNRPFNEYILLLTDYGLAGFIVFLLVCWFLWRSFRQGRHENMVRIAGSSLLSIAVFAFFSYPLRYPFVWIMLILSMAIIIYKAKYAVKISDAVIYPALLLMIPAIILSGTALYQRMANEILWRRIADKSLLGKTEQMLPKYNHLYKSLKSNELFLYNYAAELNVTERYKESLQIASKCEILWADYDLQMLMADNYQQMQNYSEAEKYYKKAAAMCPVKFMPLYRLYQLYEATGQKEKELSMAGIILKKPVKVMSQTIQDIKNNVNKKFNIYD
jgi:O-antigen ligase